MKCVVLDTNVWISGLAFRGRVRPLIKEAIRRGFEVAVSRDLMEELARVLGGRKFGYSSEVVNALLHEMRKLARVVSPSDRVNVIAKDPSDDRVLECALAAGAQIIVSGDKHLLSLGEFRGIRILSPVGFLREIRGGEADPPRMSESPAGYRTRKKRRKSRKGNKS